MGFTFSGGVQRVTGFGFISARPFDALGFVDTRQDLNLPTHPTEPGVFLEEYRFPGRTVFVVDEGVEYQLKKGVTDAHWEVKAAGGAAMIGVWTPGTEYVEGQIVWHDKQLWRAKSTHTSAADFETDEANWEGTVGGSSSEEAIGDLKELIDELETEGYE